MKKVFIDGKAGTTGLRIYDRLKERGDISLVTLPGEKRKDTEARREALNSADIVFLCLPDDAAREAASMIENNHTVVIDASTAHRTEKEWTYGFPELSAEQCEKVKSSRRIAVPGCHASGFVALVYPLIKAGLLTPETLLCCHSITGYSGGGNKMIAEYEAEVRPELYDAPRQYALSQQHKHLKEMRAVTGLENIPVFCPIVSDYYSGMEVTVPLFKSNLAHGSADDIKELYRQTYSGPVVSFVPGVNEDGFISACALSGLDRMEVTVAGNDERILLISRFDNLGKGASGAAVQCMNIVMGAEPTEGLSL